LLNGPRADTNAKKAQKIVNREYCIFEKPLDSATLCFYSYEIKKEFPPGRP